MRDGSPDARAALARQGRYQTVRDNLRVKEVRLGDGDAASGSSSATTPPRPNATRPSATTRSPGSRPSSTGSQARAAARRRRPAAQAEAAHTRAECALRDHPTLGRYLRQTASGRLVIDRAKIAAEAAPGRQVPALHLRPRPLRRGRRARLQEPARGRTRLPRPEDHARAAARVPPPRAPHPRPRPDLLARAAADPRSPNATPARPGGGSPPSWPPAPRHPHRPRRHRRPDHHAHHRPDRHSSRLPDPRPPPSNRPTPRLTCHTPPAGARHAWTHAWQTSQTPQTRINTAIHGQKRQPVCPSTAEVRDTHCRALDGPATVRISNVPSPRKVSNCTHASRMAARIDLIARRARWQREVGFGGGLWNALKVSNATNPLAMSLSGMTSLQYAWEGFEVVSELKFVNDVVGVVNRQSAG